MKKLLSISFVIAILSITYSSCKKDSNSANNQPQGQVEFALSLSDVKSIANSSAESGVASVIITVENLLSQTIINSEKVDLYNMNGNYISKPISLTIGGYKLTRFLVLDALNNVIYASPIEGSAKEYLVKDPLPISFNVQKDRVAKLMPEVLSTANSQPEDFGYTTFSFDITETFDFLVGAFIYNDSVKNFELTTANIKITDSSNNIIYTGKLLSNQDSTGKTMNYDSLGITNKITLPERYSSFIIEISKNGYRTFKQTFTKDELKLYYRSEDKGPLIVILDKSSLPSEGLVAYYKFDGDILDYSGNNNHGILNGATLTSDRNGNPQSAYKFSNSYILVPGFGNVLPTGEISVSLWAKTLTMVSNFALLLTPDNGDRFGVSLNYYHNGVNSIFWDFGWEHTGGDAPGRLYSLTVPFDSNWHHYTVIASNALKIMKIYKDGVLVCSKTDVLTIEGAVNKDLRIGSGYNANYFNGMLDEIRIYNRIISDEEVNILANQ